MTRLPRAVLWDMDGTLLDSEKLWDVAMADLAAKLGVAMTHELRQSTLGNSMVDALTRLFDAAAVPAGDRDLDGAAQWLRDRVSELFADGIPWRPGAQDLLDLVAGLDIPMALVTNTERVLTDKALPTVGANRFAVTFCGDEVPVGKPAPDLYLAAAAHLGVAPAECLVVEDSPTGSAAALAAGCPTLVVPSDAPVPSVPGRVHRDSLVGVDAAVLAEAFRVAGEGLDRPAVGD
ncbi:HAD family hydrolase [Williamsia deligens]|uniref:HAD family hydrolase n=1 Tax=Williamsia deligens TaxID=321325 RepID=A0ABW3GDC0_9NOCA|nr:HAD family phosphatase [Williamsia deligens]MCP2195219.1 haloacid dehalogenase superfamily, subfamily IA, variant 3 with third motif having DD or ED [Williamsia deligens]